MWSVLISLSLLLSPVAQVEGVLQTLSQLDTQPDPAKVALYVHPESGVRVDVAKEGSRKPVWKVWKADGDKKSFDETLGPVFKAGIFKATPDCRGEGKLVTCSLMTPTSMPREVVFSMNKDSWKMVEIRWAPEPDEPDDDDGDDDGLPM